jgi:hypothetical protein
MANTLVDVSEYILTISADYQNIIFAVIDVADASVT